MTKILGIDPGLRFTGWGVIEKQGSSLTYIASGVVKSSGKEIEKRLHSLYLGLLDVIETHQPDEIAMEETFVNTNPKSSLSLGQARGALIVAIANSGKDFFEYSATHIKKSITGLGRADKGQIQTMLAMLLPKAEWNSEDEADALAVAITHAGEFRV